MKQKRVMRTIGGGKYVPPAVKGSPTIQSGVATFKLAMEPDATAKQSYKTAFRNCCQQKKLKKLVLIIHGCTITIKKAAAKILWKVMEWTFGIEPPTKSPRPNATPRAMMRKLETLFMCGPNPATR